MEDSNPHGSNDSTLDLLTGGSRLGYGRVSTDPQHLERQIDELKRAGCYQIYLDKSTGANLDRPQFKEVIKALRPGDTLVVWSLDRLGRSIVDLIKTVNWLTDKNINIESLTENIDTTSAAGRMNIGIFALFADYQRQYNHEQTMNGLKAARARGRVGGRKPKFSKKEIRQIKALSEDPTITISDIAARFEVSRTTIYKYLAEAEEQQQ